MKKIILNTIQKTSPNYRKYSALVDDEDFEKVNKYNWFVDKKRSAYYAATKINGKRIYMHKFITNYKMSDHIDGDGLNNQKNNLREATKSQNAMNCQSYKNSSSEYKGVSWNKRNKKWMAYIKLKGKHHHLGYYLYAHNAALAYNEAAIKYHGEFAKLNIIFQQP